MFCFVWKGFFVDVYVFKKVEVVCELGCNEVIKIWLCCLIILFQFVGLIFGVYNGQKYILVLVFEDMIGQKFGEYLLICIYYGYVVDKKVKWK